MNKITPFLWFDDRAEEAANFYVSIFDDSEITGVARYPEGTPGKAGSVMTVGFTLAGQPFTALNGGPNFRFTPAISFVVNCSGQEEIDRLWDALSSDGGVEVECGWVTDRFGLSWQIVPESLPDLIERNPEKVMGALLKMKKLDIAELEAAGD